MSLILGVLIAESGVAQTPVGLLDKLGLPEGNYWVASNGIPMPLSQLGERSPEMNEVLLLRHHPDGLEPIGWFEISEQDYKAAFASPGKVLVDGSAPTADLSLSGNWLETDTGALVAAPDVKLVLAFEDAAGVNDWTLTDFNKPSSANSRWAPGEHELTLTATDVLGNNGQAGSLNFSVDNSGPSIEWEIRSDALAQGPNGAVYAPPVTVQLSAADHAGIQSLEIDDGGGWQSVNASTSLSIQSSGFRARARDGLGNMTETVADWLYDLEAPQIHISALGVAISDDDEIALPVGEAIDIVVTDDGVGVAEASYRYNRKKRRTLPGAIRFVDRGWYQLQIRAVDKLGNERIRHVDVRTSPRAYRPSRAGRVMGDQP
ncbi:MAG: hypothetical protein AB8B96_04405 [Lysobacterales bacterium]